MIRFDEVSKQYPGGHQALKQVSFELNKGEMAFLTGRSGAGKSTLLKLIMRTEELNQGQILVGNRNIHRMAASEIPFHRRRIGVVFQDHQLLFDRTVFDNVMLPLRIEGYDKHEAARRVRAALDKVGLLNKEKLNPVTLSGGEQQRVGIARAVVNRPQILLADEPTGNLDPDLAAEIMLLFEQFNQIGVSMLIASHDLSLITRLKHRILTLDHGSLIKDELQPSKQEPASRNSHGANV
ncbi:MAG: cell division ATP-binding protein FtsE [Pseudohongiella sp.]|nr:cell division ATP-binding protein FtsE [Pseudohongiella sp.]MDO9521118.1 cell division ATP-binding protein FtsE [Pseudohongiella sp.]MDP2126697.1 cell division ATP-binding protein FtsE [Pseudohongiella sp.]